MTQNEFRDCIKQSLLLADVPAYAEIVCRNVKTIKLQGHNPSSDKLVITVYDVGRNVLGRFSPSFHIQESIIRSHLILRRLHTYCL